jgi:hypothetical protein
MPRRNINMKAEYKFGAKASVKAADQQQLAGERCGNGRGLSANLTAIPLRRMRNL